MQEEKIWKNILKMILNMLVCFLILILTASFSSVAYRIRGDRDGMAKLLSFLIQVFSTIFCVWLYVKWILGRRLRDYYIRKPAPEAVWSIAAVVMPVCVSAFYLVFVPGVLVRNPEASHGIAGYVIGSILGGRICYGICEEIIYRGVILRSIEEALGKKMAVVISSFLFGCSYLYLADRSNRFGSIAVLAFAGTAGAALALVTYQSGSIWSSAVIHVGYLILGGASSLLRIAPVISREALFTYSIRTYNRLILGNLGPETNINMTLPAWFGFLSVAAIALARILRGKRQDVPKPENIKAESMIMETEMSESEAEKR